MKSEAEEERSDAKPAAAGCHNWLRVISEPRQ